MGFLRDLLPVLGDSLLCSDLSEGLFFFLRGGGFLRIFYRSEAILLVSEDIFRDF